MTSPQSLTLAVDASGVATVTLARADKHNALSAELIDALAATAVRLGTDADVRAVVLTGAGQSFCAGADLGWMRTQMAADRADRMAEARRLAEMLDAFNRLPKPMIGRVNGQAFGGGVGLMAVCDVVIAVPRARFGFTETRLGLIPATISPYVLARMGEGRARTVFMSSRLFGAEEARDLGLVHRIVAEEDLDAAVVREIEPYLSAAPQAVAASKALARVLGPKIDAAVIEDTVRRLADTWETEEARQGIAAFFERRPPPWAGRADR